MALRDSNTGTTLRQYSVKELIDAAKMMRAYDLVALCAAGSGHAGGTLSIMDITAALYLRVAEHDPKNPAWSKRDRVVWSTGQKVPNEAGFGVRERERGSVVYCLRPNGAGGDASGVDIETGLRI
jgi:hypothetical protein